MREQLAVRRLATFAVLMENGKGIIGKAPSYIAEKFRSVNVCETTEELMGLLDGGNQQKLQTWIELWQ